jgi:hypothetical protein
LGDFLVQSPDLLLTPFPKMAHLGHRTHYQWSPFSQNQNMKKVALKNLALDITMTLVLMSLFAILGYFAREFALDLQASFFGM